MTVADDAAKSAAASALAAANSLDLVADIVDTAQTEVVAAATTQATAAQTARTGAETAQGLAEDARDAATAIVIADADTVVATAINTPGSDTEIALSALIEAATADLAAAPDTLALRRLAVMGINDSTNSLARAQQRYTDVHNLAESWTSLANWTVTGTLQVSGGKMYSGVTSGNAWATYDGLLLDTAGSRARLKTTITVPAAAGTNQGNLTIGFTTTTSGAANPASDFVGLQIATLDNSVKSWVGGGANTIAIPDSGNASPLAAGTYAVSIDIDEFGTSYTLTALDGAPAALVYRLRTDKNPGRFMIYNTDARQTSGIGVGGVAIRGDLVTSTSRTIESAAVTTVWRFDSATADHGIVLMLPTTWDSRKPLPLVIHHHGRSAYAQPEVNHYRVSAVTPTIEALLAAGYAVLSVRGALSGQNGWGNQTGLNYMLQSYKYVRDRYGIGPVLFYGISMGGIATLNLLRARTIPNVLGWYGAEPVCNLANMFANNTGLYAADIRTAYGIAADGSDYATKTAGYDPALADPSEFRGVPMRFTSSPSDTVVTKTANSDTLSALVTGYAPERTVVTASGAHDDASHFDGTDIVAFFNRCLGV